MGDEISMRSYTLFFLAIFCSISMADNSQEEIEHYNQLFGAINEQRKGLNESELKTISDPFLKTKAVSIENNNNVSDNQTFDLQAIFSNKAKISGHWYRVKDKIGEYELVSIGSKSITLANKDEKIDLNLTKGANKNVIIKIK